MRYKVLEYMIENLGGGTMVIFGKLKDLEENKEYYFAGNEDCLNLYKIDMREFYVSDKYDGDFCSSKEFLEIEEKNRLLYIYGYSEEYEEIIGQTNY